MSAVAGGASRDDHPAGAPRSSNVVWHEGEVSRDERRRAAGVAGASIWFTGLSGSGKSTVAAAVERLLLEAGRIAYLLDGDNLRHGLNGDLGFDTASRNENVRRVAEVARLFADAGVIALVPVISPYREGREHARAIHREAALPFLEVFVDTPIEICEQRDPKGLYRKARAGEITGFTGIDDPYEAPLAPDVRIDGATTPVEQAARLVIEALGRHGAGLALR